MEKIENKIEKEKGANIEMVLHILRHGDRTPEGILEEYGRERTSNEAHKKSYLYNDDSLKIKSFGSPAGLKSEESGMQRSLETAHIYGKTISENKKGTLYKSRPKNILNYEDWDVLLIDPEYDYMKNFDDALEMYLKKHYGGKKYDELSENEQKQASFYASNIATKYYMELDTDIGIKSKKEVAGTFAVLIDHYIKMISRLKSNQNFLFPIGSHTGMMEPFLGETVIWEDGNNKKYGATLNELGGIFKPSEGFNINLKTDQDGNLENVKIIFDDSKRLGGKEIFLDMNKINELVDFYNKLHQKKIERSRLLLI